MKLYFKSEYTYNNKVRKMSKSRFPFQLICCICSVLLLASCDRGGDALTDSPSQTGGNPLNGGDGQTDSGGQTDGGGQSNDDTTTTPSEVISTINAYYSKGPVTDAIALLNDVDGNIIAGPESTVNGHVTFKDVVFNGAVYIIFSGGSYIDEASGMKVILDGDFKMRSGFVDITDSGTRTLTATPLTEIGFQRAASQNGGVINLNTVNNQIVQIADEYGLDEIDLITAVPTALESITGSSDADRYGAALAGISQQLRNARQTPNTYSLRNYIKNNVNVVDQGAFATAVIDLQNNAGTQGFIKTTLVNNITTHVGTGIPGFTIGGTVTGLEGNLVLKINDVDDLPVSANGVFSSTKTLLRGANYSVAVSSQPSGQTCSISDGSGAVTSGNVNSIAVNCTRNLNFVWIGNGAGPAGVFWYVGDKQWELDAEFSCESYTETALGESTISLRNAAGTENLVINIKDKTIISDPNTGMEVYGSGYRVREESNTVCPSTKNDYTPVMTSAAEFEVNSSRTMVVKLTARDADLPSEQLSFSLTSNPASDNKFFRVSNFSEQARAACRTNNNGGYPDDPNSSKYYTVRDGVNSVEECQAACNEYSLLASGGARNCTGFEFRAEGADSVDTTARCELWNAPIVATAPQPAYGCYKRESERPSVLSFIKPQDFRSPMDADVNNVYEVEAEVSDGANSSTQNIRVMVVPNGDYIGRAGTACRAGYEDEGNPKDLNNSKYFNIVNDVKTLEDCQALCDAYPLSGDPGVNCMGVEYRVKGADYAELSSRCELWKVPVLAMTPQKEYSCYARDLVRSVYGPDLSAYLGEYKAGYVDADNKFVTATMTLTQLTPSDLRWTENGKSWTVSRAADRNTLTAGDDYPFKDDGYEVLEVYWDAEEVAGIKGPSGRVYSTDWAHAKQSHSQAVYQEYIKNHPGELIKVTEAARQIRELKWDIAEKLNTAQGYRDYKADLGICGAGDPCYGRTDEANRRIEGFIAYVTAELLQIEVDDAVPLFGEDNDLELFYNLEFTKDDNKPRPDDYLWRWNDLMLQSAQKGPRSYTSVSDGVDTAFVPIGYAEKTIVANESQGLRYGGLMFEYDTDPEWPNKPGCEDFDQSGSCREPGYSIGKFFSTTPLSTGNPEIPVINGIFDSRWDGHRTWAGNVATATESLNHTYFSIKLADLEYDVPKIDVRSINFAPNEPIRMTYVLTKRNQEQFDEYLAANTLMCEDPPVKRDKLIKRNTMSMEGPGFLIRNETDHTYSVSLNQVGPLRYGEVLPGQIFARDTAWGHFTIDASVNLTGEAKYDDWDAILPVAQFTAEVMLTAFTAGAPITSMESAISAGVEKAGTTLARTGASALGRTAFGKAMLRSGTAAIQKAAASSLNKPVFIKLVTSSGRVAKDLALNTALNEAFTKDLVNYIYNEEARETYTSWNHSGFYGSTVEMHHIVGGPRLPCLNADGDLEIRTSPLRILTNDECRERPDICVVD